MSSTQIKNHLPDYLCEKRQNEAQLKYLIEPLYAEQKKPCHLFVLGSIPTKMSSHHFTHNHIDVESTLRGTRSTNLEGPSFSQNPTTKSFFTQDLFHNHLRDTISVPRPIFHDKNTRTGFHNI
tara:strand:+ start:581 stop:949 length:369 start_codon:yes stop_codon:yes gene_type:complete